MLNVHALQAAALDYWHLLIPNQALQPLFIHRLNETSNYYALTDFGNHPFEKTGSRQRPWLCMTHKSMKHAYHCVHNGGLVTNWPKLWQQTPGVMGSAQMVVCCPSPSQINPILDASAELL